ncbi:MAG TPA: FKBP-type peptidyl-prolyl cis-trans isomerase N-terminal domain-containing protein [Candidatus Cloacimonadota bacterium]|nr:FKBP-type peptidyl-prolyl cis-trans isomerase N-terminal domain-containing protein [Candidatus Cloacimonadota bacterium]
MKNAQDSLNYSLGLQIGKSFNATLTEVDYTMFVRGMKDSKDPDRIALTDEQIADIMNVYQQNAQARMLKKHEEDAKKNKEDQEKFFAKNIKNKGIIALNGIQYKVLEEGKGSIPTTKDNFELGFVGKTIDGKVFWDSNDMGEPLIVTLDDVLPGWKVALEHMKEGAKWEIYLPDSLAFGEYGAGEVGPNQAVVFELFLKEIKKK